MKTTDVRGIPISRLGMGCWAYGGGAYWGAQAQSDVNEVVARAIDAGATYFDTAEAYNDGASESSLGEALKGRRQSAVIGTKVSPDHAHPKALRASCEASLARLQTDVIDIYMMHWPINARAIAHFSGADASPASVEDAFGEMIRLKDEGKIRAVGVSNFGVEQMEQLLALGVPVAVNELPYNLLSRAIEREILPFCIRHDIAVLGYMALMQGVLADIYPSISDVPSYQAHSRHFAQNSGKGTSRHHEDGCEALMETALGEIRALCGEIGQTMPHVALAWAMARPGITSTLVGSRNAAELLSNLKTESDSGLSPETIARLDAITKPVWDALGDSPDYYENRNDSRVR